MRVIQFGIGPIGLKVTAYLSEKPNIEIVGAIDSDVSKRGADLGELAALSAPLGVKVSAETSRILNETKADVVILTTSSTLKSIQPQIMEIVSTGKNVVSSCEELVYPWNTQPAVAEAIDSAARKHNVSVLSTGINPGFLMDFLPLVMTGICQQVRKVTVKRIQNAIFRRIPFQKKIGAGLTVEEFTERVEAGILRHVGLVESIHLLASGLGWMLDKAEDTISPVLASHRVTTSELTIEPGMAAGVRQIGRGFMNGEEVIKLLFQATMEEQEPRDRIIIEGKPNLNLTIKEGVNGDVATTAIIVNAIPVVCNAAPGLRTMVDVGLIPFQASC
jgi:hypothetical protein